MKRDNKNVLVSLPPSRVCQLASVFRGEETTTVFPSASSTEFQASHSVSLLFAAAAAAAAATQGKHLFFPVSPVPHRHAHTNKVSLLFHFGIFSFPSVKRTAHTSLFGITRSIDSSTLISRWIKINSQQNKLVIQSHHIHVKCGHAAAANHAPIRRSSIILWITFQLHVSILYAACRVNRRKYVWKAFQLNTFSSFSFPFQE